MKFIQSISYFLSRHSEKTIFNGIELKHRIYEKGKVRVPRNHIQQNWPLTYFILAWPPLSSRKLETSCYCLVPRRGRGYEKINAASTKEQQLHRFKSLKRKTTSYQAEVLFDAHLSEYMCVCLGLCCIIWGIAMKFAKKRLDMCPYDYICVSMIYLPVYSFETKNKEDESSKFETFKCQEGREKRGCLWSPWATRVMLSFHVNMRRIRTKRLLVTKPFHINEWRGDMVPRSFSAWKRPDRSHIPP